MDETTYQIGERLRRARATAGLEIEDVVFQTRIPKSALVALESDHFSHFISPVYAKSFLAQYSEFLTVDASPWLEALEPGCFVEGGQMLPLLDDAAAKTVEYSKFHKKDIHHGAGKWHSSIWVIALSCAVIVASVKAYQFFEHKFGIEPLVRHDQDATRQDEQSEAKAKKPVAADSPHAGPPSAEEASTILGGENQNRIPPRAIIVR